MLELLLGLAVCMATYKVADADGMSGPLWLGVSLLVCFASLALIPLPFIRMLIAGVLIIGIMVGAKFVASKRD